MEKSKHRYRTVWISDIHLGTRQCQADLLLNFLREMECKSLFLVGDIVDVQALKSRWAWSESHNTVIQKILRLSRKGTEVIYVIGNHDEAFIKLLDETHRFFLGGIMMVNQHRYQLLDGRMALVLHGHEFDGAVRSMPWLYWLGDQAYGVALSLNYWFNIIRKYIGKPYWSLSAFLKSKVKGAVKFINNFEVLVRHEAQKMEVQTVIAGHIHVAAIKEYGDFSYYNDGDWCESCTALVESHEGELFLVNHKHERIALNLE